MFPRRAGKFPDAGAGLIPHFSVHFPQPFLRRHQQRTGITPVLPECLRLPEKGPAKSPSPVFRCRDHCVNIGPFLPAGFRIKPA